ncbi:MAG: peptidase, partial [Blastochloris sp.]|nr:peptidase [Blastochloris sp.]
MNQRLYLMIAAGLTTFVLVVIGGVASRLSATATPAPTAAAAEFAA